MSPAPTFRFLQLPDGLGTTDTQAVATDGETHGLIEVTKMRIDGARRSLSIAATGVVTYEDDLAGLVRRYRKADLELGQNVREARGVDTPQGLFLGLGWGLRHVCDYSYRTIPRLPALLPQ